MILEPQQDVFASDQTIKLDGGREKGASECLILKLNLVRWEAHRSCVRDYFVWQSNEHEGVARPYVEMIRIKEEGRIAVLVVSCRHFKFNILMRNIFLLKIHSMQKHQYQHTEIIS